MIRVTPAPEPPDFDKKVRQPGHWSLDEKVGQASSRPKGQTSCPQCSDKLGKPITQKADIPASELKPYWRDALPELQKAYQEICAFSCFRIHPVTGAATVDHMLPKSRRYDRAYEWDNYRLCASQLNANKGDFGDVLDPFDVQDDWFCLNLVGYRVYSSRTVESAVSVRVEQTIKRLKLNDSTFLRTRKEHHRDYDSGPDDGVSFAWLQKNSPFLARELKRQERLR